VVAAMGQSTAPRLAKYYAGGNIVAFVRLLVKLLGVVACLGGGMVFLLALFGQPILGFFYGAQFKPHVDLAVYLMLAAAMMYLTAPLGRAVAAMRRFKSLMIIRTIGILILLSSLPTLIGAYGLKGAAAAMFFSALFTLAAHAGVVFLAVRRFQKITAEEGAGKRTLE